MNCIIVGASKVYGKIEPARGDLVIAADGGLDRLLKAGITPHLVIGDLDSQDSVPEGLPLKTFPVRKDKTDMHLCYLEGKARGYVSFLLYGGTGGREDHTLANYQLLLNMARSGCLGILIGEGSFAFVIDRGECELQLPRGVGVSVFAFGGTASGVDILGLSYEADNISLSPDFPLGVSNSAGEGSGRIAVREGSLLIMVGTEYLPGCVSVKNHLL
jgi:thiamine pyrophosphokinase